MGDYEDVQAKLAGAVEAGRGRAMDCLRRWAGENSGTLNRSGLARTAALVTEDFSFLGVRPQLLALPEFTRIDDRGDPVSLPLGDVLCLAKRPEAPVQVLLVAHLDTVFGPESGFTQLSEPGDGTLRGPGVADDKGGVAVALLALEAFETLACARNLGWRLWLSPDEELGSRGSGSLLAEAAATAHLGLVLEPAQPGGDLVGARKGSGNYDLVVRGRAAHAGRNPQDGRNAVLLAAQAAQELDGFNDGSVQVNVGVLRGGTAVNAVPDLAVLRFNVRVVTALDQARVEERLTGLVRRLTRREGFGVELHGGVSRPPRPLGPVDLALLETAAGYAREQGRALAWRDSGGASDVNLLTVAGLPAVDGLGPEGGGLHSGDEFVRLDSIGERGMLVARLLAAAATGALRLEQRV